MQQHSITNTYMPVHHTHIIRGAKAIRLQIVSTRSAANGSSCYRVWWHALGHFEFFHVAFYTSFN